MIVKLILTSPPSSITKLLLSMLKLKGASGLYSLLKLTTRSVPCVSIAGIKIAMEINKAISGISNFKYFLLFLISIAPKKGTVFNSWER